MNRHPKLIRPKFSEAETYCYGNGARQQTSGSQFFAEGIFGADEEQFEEEIESDGMDEDDKPLVKAKPRDQRRKARGTKSKENKNVERKTADDDPFDMDDLPVPENGYFDGGARMW